MKTQAKRLISPVGLAVLIAAIAAVWILSGIVAPSSQQDTNPTAPPLNQNDTSSIRKVRVQDSRAQPMEAFVPVTGITEAARRVELRSEVAGQVAAVPVAYGDVVKKGQTLVRIAVDERQAALQRAREETKKAQLEYDAALSLQKKGFNSEVRVAEKRAALEAARASLREAELAVGNLKITSPFDGVFDERQVEQGDYVSIGSQIGVLLDLTPINFIAYVSEKFAQSIAVGKTAKVRFLDGQTTQAVVTFVAAEANEATRTFRVELETDNQDRKIKAGLTAQVTIPLTPKLAHKLTPSTLTLSENGAIGIKAVDQGGNVSFHPAKILQSSNDSIWLGGLPDDIMVITVGQEYVIAGQSVDFELIETPDKQKNPRQ